MENTMHAGGRRAATRWPTALAFASLLLAGAAHSAAPDLAKAEELLQAGQAAEALVLFEQALEADPSSVGAHLGLGRAYYALGQYARARIEFETVLQYDNLPQDLHSQTEVYDKAAADYAAGRLWRPFYYAETGIGNYRQNTSSSTADFRRCRRLRHLPAHPRRRRLEPEHDRAPLVQRHARLPLSRVRRQQPAQRFGPALEPQRQSPGR